MATKRKNSEIRREEALNLAMKIIHEEGIHSLTLRRVAEGLEISEAALFRHFKDKEEMINLLATKVFDHYIVRESNGYEDVEAGLLKIMINQFSSFQGTPEATSVLFQEEIFRDTRQSKRASTRDGIRGRTELPGWSGMQRPSTWSRRPLIRTHSP